ncbi:M15 family metallopeptidase [Mycolicibacterium brisbanense]
MANRTVYGNDWSSNGWPMVDQGSCTWVNVPGTNVTLQIQNGQPLAILRAFAADFNAYVEPLRDADSACWTATNSVSTSNHLSGTAMDLNWNSHPFQIADAGFDAAKIARVRELLGFYEGTVFWGNDWSDPKDAMHFQLSSLANGGNINTYGNPAVGDFIARKIRADGFSTFRRGAAPAIPAAVDVLARATGLTAERAAQILPTMSDGLKQAECTNPNRIAMFVAQTGHESANFNATEEYASGAAYEGRTDLGNTQPGDGVRFKGRTWIQITGRAHYAEFSQWAFDRGLVPSATYFVDHPTELADLRWAGIGAAWYWTESRPMNALVDAGENAQWGDYRGFAAVTAAINGGTNGIDERRARYNRALALGDQLLTLTTGEDDDMFTEDDRNLLKQISGIFRVSKSPLRHLGEKETNTCAGFAWAADGLTHPQFVAMAAKVGHQDSLRLLAEVAGADPVKFPDRQDDAALARNILADIEATNPTVLQQFLANQKGN